MLTKATWILASIFLMNCVLMAYLASSSIKEAETVMEKPVE
jgi:preprotein translocase subunit SecG